MSSKERPHSRFFPKKNTPSQRASVFFVIGAGFAFMILFAASHQAHAVHRPEEAPKIVNWNYRWSIDSDEEAEELAEWDVLILDIENEHYNRDRIQLIKEINPDIKILAYISMVDIRPDAATLDQGTSRRYLGAALEEHPEWVTKLANGNNAEWWPEFLIMNITADGVTAEGERFNDFFIKFIRDAVVKDTIWDGVFFDNVWEDVSFVSSSLDLNADGITESSDEANNAWRKGVKKVLKKTQKNAKKYRNNFILSGNGGVRYYRHVNGVGFEHFPSTVYGGWTESLGKYFFIMRHAARDPYALINTNVNNTGNREDYRKFRYGLTSTLLNDGYYSFDDGDQSHHQEWYYDEYDILLGEPVSGAYNLLRPDDATTLRDGVWRRDFENASVFVNSTNAAQRVTLEEGFEKFKGVQDPITNSGTLTGSVTVPAQDGIVLLQRLSQVRDATFINGAYSKVFDENGTQVRNSFFAYDGSFEGGSQIHKISSENKTVVAGDTYVRVYNNRNEVTAEFAPYGTSYANGVNIAVGKLYGKKKGYYIVTGNAKGSTSVKIYDLNGAVIHPGCAPYPREVAVGVNVAVGDLDGNNKLEIVVSAGYGGGPHIRILNNVCEVIHPGFFAYDKNVRFGVNMTVGDVDGDGASEIIAGAGPGGGPHVRIFDSRGTLLSPGFFAYDKNDRSGVLVSAADTDGDGDAEIVTNSFAIFNPF